MAVYRRSYKSYCGHAYSGVVAFPRDLPILAQKPVPI